MTGEPPVEPESIELREVLDRRANAPSEDRVFVEGGWVDRAATVPLDRGVEAVARFAGECWQRNVQLNRQVLTLTHELETALYELRRQATQPPVIPERTTP